MNPELARRINEKEEWTFEECVGLASELKVKTRVVIAAVYASGKQYIDRKEPEPE